MVASSKNSGKVIASPGLSVLIALDSLRAVCRPTWLEMGLKTLSAVLPVRVGIGRFHQPGGWEAWNLCEAAAFHCRHRGNPILGESGTGHPSIRGGCASGGRESG